MSGETPSQAHRQAIAEAEQHGWLGEVDGLHATLAAADDKLAEMATLASRPRTVHLGLPALTTGGAR